MTDYSFLSISRLLNDDALEPAQTLSRKPGQHISSQLFSQ